MTHLSRDDVFQIRHGTVLSNVKPGLPPDAERPGTCAVCATPVPDGYGICRRCKGARSWAASKQRAFPLDQLAFLTYAVEGPAPSRQSGSGAVGVKSERKGRQAYAALLGYKSGSQQHRHQATVADWLGWFLGTWGPWSDRPEWTRKRDWMWATVPSTRSGRPGEHPLHRLVSTLLGSHPEAVVTAVSAGEDRVLNPALFSCPSLTPGANVVLVDDSWTTGTSLLSAAAALRRDGAGVVNAMVLGRLLNPGNWSQSKAFIDAGGLELDYGDGFRPGFDPRRSPWAKVG
jgi:hypothetical protein